MADPPQTHFLPSSAVSFDIGFLFPVTSQHDPTSSLYRVPPMWFSPEHAPSSSSAPAQTLPSLVSPLSLALALSPLLGSSQLFVGGGGGAGMMGFFSPEAPFLLPTPISTADFPRPRGLRLPRPRVVSETAAGPTVRKRGRDGRGDAAEGSHHHDSGSGELCCICLETLSSRKGWPLPCEHRLHALCLWGLLTMPCLGASSMLRCPLPRGKCQPLSLSLSVRVWWTWHWPRQVCRQAVDRHDLAALGYDVSPRHLAWAARTCADLRALRQHQGGGAAASAAAIRRCARLSAADGFVYNTCVVALERMLLHKLRLVDTLRDQLAHPSNADCDVTDVVRMSVDCHVEVLMHIPSGGA